MRFTIPLATFFALVASVGVARAQDASTIAGNYDSTFEAVANNCTDVGLSMTRAQVKITASDKRSVTVEMPEVPTMNGRSSKGGKVRARAGKGKTATPDIDGRFAVSGRADRGKLQLVFVAEFFRGDKPLCTQSWNVTGSRR